MPCSLLRGASIVYSGAAMGRIVVGVDGSPASVAALKFALEEARLRRATVLAVHAWVLPLFEGVPGPFLLPVAPDPPLEQARSLLEAQAARVLDEAIAHVAAERPADVEVVSKVVEAAPAAALLEAAEDAELLVVGSRGRGGFAGLLLGSVSQRCAQRATCPVVIVRTSPNA